MIYKKIYEDDDKDKDSEDSDESMDCRGDDHELFGVQD